MYSSVGNVMLTLHSTSEMKKGQGQRIYFLLASEIKRNAPGVIFRCERHGDPNSDRRSPGQPLKVTHCLGSLRSPAR